MSQPLEAGLSLIHFCWKTASASPRRFFSPSPSLFCPIPSLEPLVAAHPNQLRPSADSVLRQAWQPLPDRLHEIPQECILDGVPEEDYTENADPLGLLLSSEPHLLCAYPQWRLWVSRWSSSDQMARDRSVLTGNLYRRLTWTTITRSMAESSMATRSTSWQVTYISYLIIAVNWLLMVIRFVICNLSWIRINGYPIYKSMISDIHSWFENPKTFIIPTTSRHRRAEWRCSFEKSAEIIAIP